MTTYYEYTVSPIDQRITDSDSPTIEHRPQTREGGVGMIRDHVVLSTEEHFRLKEEEKWKAVRLSGCMCMVHDALNSLNSLSSLNLLLFFLLLLPWNRRAVTEH